MLYDCVADKVRVGCALCPVPCALCVHDDRTWPTEWKQYTILLAHGHYMQTGDASLADQNFDSLLNNTMFPFIDPHSQLVNFTSSYLGTEGDCPLFPTGVICNSPQCHEDAQMMDTEHSDGAGKRCDNIDWLPKFRAGYVYSNTSTIINAFAVRGMAMLAELASATGRAEAAQLLNAQSERTRAAMLRHLFSEREQLWCDGVCAEMYSPQDSVEDMAWWGYNGTSFHSQHYPLSLGITPEAAIPAAQRYLQEQGMVGSTYSANSLLHGLYDAAYWVDYGATALGLMTQCGAHSWCHMLNENATTSWEHWYEHDGTHSHVWSASPAGAIASGLMGIKPTKPGWTKWMVRPAPGDLHRVNITVPTPKGAIKAIYSHSDDPHDGIDVRQLDVTVPDNTEATVCMPLFGQTEFTLILNGKTTTGQPDHGTYVCLEALKEPKLEVRVILHSNSGGVSVASPPPPSPSPSPSQSPVDLLLGEVDAIMEEAVRYGGRPPALPRLKINPKAISISGLSAGADFASQFAVAFSRTIMGVGVFAGQPAHCAVQRFANDTLYNLTDPSVCNDFCEGCPAGKFVACDHCKHSLPDQPGVLKVEVDVSVLAASVRRMAAAGVIDPVSNLRRTKVYTYCGTKDWHLGGSIANARFFAEFGLPENQLSNFSIPSGHAWPEDSGIKQCGDEADQGFWAVENCGYDGPGALLEHVYGKLRPRAETMVPEHLRQFDQLPFNPGGTQGAANVGLGERGLVYVPRSCAGGEECALHVSMHGCSNPWFLESAQAHTLSFNRWAETNRMVILWPHIANAGYNHTGPGSYPAADDTCWDAYGKTGEDYDHRSGPQMRAIQAMIEGLSGVPM